MISSFFVSPSRLGLGRKFTVVLCCANCGGKTDLMRMFFRFPDRGARRWYCTNVVPKKRRVADQSAPAKNQGGPCEQSFAEGALLSALMLCTAASEATGEVLHTDELEAVAHALRTFGVREKLGGDRTGAP